VKAIFDILDKMKKKGLCHGDLHLGNIVFRGKKALLIDIN